MIKLIQKRCTRKEQYGSATHKGNGIIDPDLYPIDTEVVLVYRKE